MMEQPIRLNDLKSKGDGESRDRLTQLDRRLYKTLILVIPASQYKHSVLMSSVIGVPS